MTVVQQSGLITPGHVALWGTNGVIQDGGVLPAAARFSLKRPASTSTRRTTSRWRFRRRVTAFVIAGILVTNASTSLTTAVGGFYPQAAKGGVPIVPASQTFTMLTNSSLILWMTLSSFGQNTRFSSANLNSIAGFLNIWFSLTTPQGAPATADCYVMGYDLS